MAGPVDSSASSLTAFTALSDMVRRASGRTTVRRRGRRAIDDPIFGHVVPGELIRSVRRRRGRPRPTSPPGRHFAAGDLGLRARPARPDVRTLGAAGRGGGRTPADRCPGRPGRAATRRRSRRARAAVSSTCRSWPTRSGPARPRTLRAPRSSRRDEADAPGTHRRARGCAVADPARVRRRVALGLLRRTAGNHRHRPQRVRARRPLCRRGRATARAGRRRRRA